MKNIQLSIAINDYYHVRPLLDGTIQVKGADLVLVASFIEEIFWRFAKYREWDVSEMSFSNYCAIRSRDESQMVAIPVFPSRVFRHSAIYVRKSAGLARATDLAGKKVGIPEWVQTAGVYVRGQLMHEDGVALQDVQWIQAGLNEPGRVEKVPFDLPAGVRLTQVGDRSLDQMLVDGEIDAIVTARAPLSFDQRNPEIIHLFSDYDKVEEEYGLRTGIFPIMHAIVIRGDVYRQHRWIAMNLFRAFDAAKKAAIERLFEVAASNLPFAWTAKAFDRTARQFNGEYWPYGIESNRRTLEAFLQFLYEQGITTRHLVPEEIFATETQTLFRV